MCGVRGVSGRPAMMRRRDGVTATLLESASRCRGVEGVQEILSDVRAGTFAGEFSLAADSGKRDTAVFAGVARAFLPRFVHGSSSSASSSISTSIASSNCAFCFFGVTNGFSFSASSRITNVFCRVERVDLLGVTPPERVSFVFLRRDDRSVSGTYLRVRCEQSCEYAFRERWKALWKFGRRCNGWCGKVHLQFKHGGRSCTAQTRDSKARRVKCYRLG